VSEIEALQEKADDTREKEIIRKFERELGELKFK